MGQHFLLSCRPLIGLLFLPCWHFLCQPLLVIHTYIYTCTHTFMDLCICIYVWVLIRENMNMLWMCICVMCDSWPVKRTGCVCRYWLNSICIRGSIHPLTKKYGWWAESPSIMWHRNQLTRRMGAPWWALASGVQFRNTLSMPHMFQKNNIQHQYQRMDQNVWQNMHWMIIEEINVNWPRPKEVIQSHQLFKRNVRCVDLTRISPFHSPLDLQLIKEPP